MLDNDDFRTAEFGCVAALALHGIQPTRIEVNGRQKVFFYSVTPRLTEIRTNYQNDSITVPARTFATMIGRIAKQAREIQPQ